MQLNLIHIGQINKNKQWSVLDENDNIVATIRCSYVGNFKFSKNKLDVCFLDGTVEIAFRDKGETETSHAMEIISKKLKHS